MSSIRYLTSKRKQVCYRGGAKPKADTNKPKKLPQTNDDWRAAGCIYAADICMQQQRYLYLHVEAAERSCSQDDPLQPEIIRTCLLMMPSERWHGCSFLYVVAGEGGLKLETTT
jgi:hypothetical protein